MFPRLITTVRMPWNMLVDMMACSGGCVSVVDWLSCCCNRRRVKNLRRKHILLWVVDCCRDSIDWYSVLPRFGLGRLRRTVARKGAEPTGMQGSPFVCQCPPFVCQCPDAGDQDRGVCIFWQVSRMSTFQTNCQFFLCRAAGGRSLLKFGNWQITLFVFHDIQLLWGGWLRWIYVCAPMAHTDWPWTSHWYRSAFSFLDI